MNERRRVATWLFVASFVALGASYLLWAGDVKASDGTTCGSAFRASRRDLPSGGERTVAEIALRDARCERAAEAQVRAAQAAGVGFAVLGGAAVVTWLPARRS